ncbi:MAG: alginate lyase family protein [Candidatus Eisenbacteria bacterium]|nr:alginate lyase family protein [Candidatus Eisenbacteria bacterium]
MSSLGWSLARLAAMPPSEIVHRGRTAIRDRFAPPAYARWTAREAFDRLFSGSAETAVRSSPLASLARAGALAVADVPGTLDAARALAAGRWTLFGREVALADPPLWDRDPVSGVVWPDADAARIDYRRGAPKPVWELGRLTMLPTLALAARVAGEHEHAARAARWLDDWTARHTLGRGIHFASGIEMAVRVITTGWSLMLLCDDAAPAGSDAAAPALEPALGLAAQQALHLRDHLSLGSSANNHLIAEYAAMAVMGSAFPSLHGAAALAREGLAGLERETLRQIHPDGVPAEQAFGYLPFVWELLLAGLLAGETAGRPADAAVRERLAASLEFARAIRLPDGRWPTVGDEDDGRVLLADERASRLDLVGHALAAWLDADPLGDAPALALLLSGRRGRAPRAATDGRHEFPHGGYTVWRERGLHVTFDHGPLGLGRLAAHGHADALAVTIRRGGDPIVVDTGTLAYQEDAEARDRCRATPAHATVTFGGRSQSVMRGPFLWGARATVAADGEGWRCRWASGESHRRAVVIAGDEVRIDDVVTPRAGATLVFPLAPGARAETDGRTATVTIGGTVARFEADAIEGWRIEPIDVAPAFGRREASMRLVAAITGEACRTRIAIAS